MNKMQQQKSMRCSHEHNLLTFNSITIANLNKKLILILKVSFLSLLLISKVQANAEDDPILFKSMLDKIEFRDSKKANPFVLSGQFWVGQDLNKLWIKTSFETLDGETEEAELQALYSKAIAPFWDFQVGVRSDLELDSLPGRNWGVIGFQGITPYFFEVNTALFIGESGNTALRFEVEYELLLTQRLILTPELEVNFYGQNNEITHTSSGLSDLELGIRLRYEIQRGFAPYIGVSWSKKFGNGAVYFRTQGEDVSTTELVVGLRAWF